MNANELATTLKFHSEESDRLSLSLSLSLSPFLSRYCLTETPWLSQLLGDPGTVRFDEANLCRFPSDFFKIPRTFQLPESTKSLEPLSRPACAHWILLDWLRFTILLIDASNLYSCNYFDTSLKISTNKLHYREAKNKDSKISRS